MAQRSPHFPTEASSLSAAQTAGTNSGSSLWGRRRSRRRSPLILILLLLFWSVILGLGLAQASTPGAIGTVDVVPQNQQLGQQIYLENCATCHIGLPPAIMPSQTWQALIQDSQHYGTAITPIQDPYRLVTWNYLRTFSRPAQENESIPFRISQSRYFKALHPKVEFSTPINLNSCVACHPGAPRFDYRSLSAEWEDAP